MHIAVLHNIYSTPVMLFHAHLKGVMMFFGVSWLSVDLYTPLCKSLDLCMNIMYQQALGPMGVLKLSRISQQCCPIWYIFNCCLVCTVYPVPQHDKPKFPSCTLAWKCTCASQFPRFVKLNKVVGKSVQLGNTFGNELSFVLCTLLLTVGMQRGKGAAKGLIRQTIPTSACNTVPCTPLLSVGIHIITVLHNAVLQQQFSCTPGGLFEISPLHIQSELAITQMTRFCIQL